MNKTLPKPLFDVKLVQSGRSRFYEATALDGSWQSRFQGTTGISGMLDDGKSSGFAAAAAAIAKGAAIENLLRVGASPVILDDKFIKATLNGCDKEYLKVWGAKRDRGTLYHELLENRLNGNTVTVDAKFEKIWSLLQDKLREHGIDIVGAEVACASLKHGFGTKVDAVGTIMGDYGVLDWKFARMINSEHFFQVGGGSAQAFSETYGIKASWAKIFRWDFDSEYWQVGTCKSQENALRGLLGLLDVKTQIGEGLYVE